jgi:hypothetical protein
MSILQQLSTFQDLVTSDNAVKIKYGPSRHLYLDESSLANIATYFSSKLSFDEKKEIDTTTQKSIDLFQVCPKESALQKLLLRSQFSTYGASADWSLDVEEACMLFSLVERLNIQSEYRQWIKDCFTIHLTSTTNCSKVIQWAQEITEQCTSFEECLSIFKWAIVDTSKLNFRPKDMKGNGCRNCEPCDYCSRPKICHVDSRHCVADFTRSKYDVEPLLNVLINLIVPTVWLKCCYDKKTFVDIVEIVNELQLQHIEEADYNRLRKNHANLDALRPFVVQLLSFQK